MVKNRILASMKSMYPSYFRGWRIKTIKGIIMIKNDSRNVVWRQMLISKGHFLYQKVCVK